MFVIILAIRRMPSLGTVRSRPLEPLRWVLSTGSDATSHPDCN